MATTKRTTPATTPTTAPAMTPAGVESACVEVMEALGVESDVVLGAVDEEGDEDDVAVYWILSHVSDLTTAELQIQKGNHSREEQSVNRVEWYRGFLKGM